MLGNTDTHFLWQLGRTLTLIAADAEPRAVVAAIRRGQVRLVTRPLSWTHVVRFIVQSHGTVDVLQDSFRYLRRTMHRTRAARRRIDLPATGV